MKRMIGLWLLCGTAAIGCGSGDGGAGDAGDDVPVDAAEADVVPDTLSPAWFEPDPGGRTTEGNLIAAHPEMVVVTSAALAVEWEAYAAYRTLAGVLTRVVTMEEVLGAATGRDDAEALRGWLRERWDFSPLRFVLLGGDAQEVPFRRVESSITVPLSGAYTTNGPADLYFAELDADWDADGDGVWGERRADVALADLRGAELAVGRVPATWPAEVAAYVRKVAAHEEDPYGRATHPLFLSDVATAVPVLGEIDGAEAMEVTIGEVFPEPFLSHARRLYATSVAVDRWGGEILTARGVAQALLEGYPLSYHNGHGSHWQLAVELDGDWANGLDNEVPTVLASCACLSGNFADVADEPTFDGWTEQGPDDDSAGERLIVGRYGAVGYLGNTGVGLGPIGGVQFLHAFYRAMFGEGLSRMGEAYNFAHAHLREMSLTIRMVPMPMTDDSEHWTHMVVVLLGDPALAMWTVEPRPTALQTPATYGPWYNEVTVRATEPGGGPVDGATVVLRKEGDFVLRGTTDVDGYATFRFVPYGPAPIDVRATGDGLLPSAAVIRPEASS